MKKNRISHSDYTLKRRFINKFNEYTPWQDVGHGQWLGIEQVQAQIKLLVMNYRTKHMEVVFEMDGKMLDYNGNEIGEPMKFYPKS